MLVNGWALAKRSEEKIKIGREFLLLPIRRTPLQIIEQIYIRFAENTRLYRVFSHQSDKGGISHILENGYQIHK